jgi:hypothetical protein
MTERTELREGMETLAAINIEFPMGEAHCASPTMAAQPCGIWDRINPQAALLRGDETAAVRLGCSSGQASNKAQRYVQHQRFTIPCDDAEATGRSRSVGFASMLRCKKARRRS